MTDVVHDTFYWLTRQRRLWSSLILIMCLATAVVYNVIEVRASAVEQRMVRGSFDTWLDIWGDILNPFGLLEIGGREMTVRIAYICLGALSAWVFTPMLIRYFRARRSLQKISRGGYWTTIRQYFGYGAVAGVSTAAMITLCMWLQSLRVALLIPLPVMLYMWLMPCVVMGERPSIHVRLWGWLRSCALLVFLSCMVSGIPMAIFDMVDLVIRAIADTFSIISVSGKDLIGVSVLLKVLLPLSFWTAVCLLLTGAVIMHGTYCNPENNIRR